ncbi:hypothetical protein PPL_05997 [Heterostelium album PN500]|uniref:RGS domain-containing protein n=1 Tax=Heterostelium pallidum (strain ATCC 26659 / Pp 5 / PN500) TaxID=670386 RepID=D3BBX7_HETP5|nr:hypothetical protein PPL_05997 [Heterostelium album PN500]EFA81160.1 hypothetical protein PPL_05997 [Heterostelium album PN500]|eukprot:XP_020433278.1 hypothetical protein PPL_05997 [Heterostelium album PN500]
MNINQNTLSKKKLENEMYQRNSKSILNDILKNSSLRSAFYDFLKSQFCVENLLCWEAIEKYKSKNGSASEMYTMAEEIYKKFIKDNSKYEINIYSKQKDLLKEKLKKTFVLPTTINKTETFPKRKSKKKYWADVILPALKSSTSYGSGSGSGGSSNIFTNSSSSSSSSPSSSSSSSSSGNMASNINSSNHLSLTTNNSSYIYSNVNANGNGNTGTCQNQNNNNSNSNSIVSPKFFHSPRVSRSASASNPAAALPNGTSSPNPSPYTSPFCSPTHSPTSNNNAATVVGTNGTTQDIGGSITYYSTSSTTANGNDTGVGSNGYHTHSYSSSTGGFNSGNHRKSMIINGSSSFSGSTDESTADHLEVDFDDLFNDDSIDVDEVRFGSLNSNYLFNDIQEELEQMMIENSLGEFLKSKIYLERSQGNSLP